MLVLVILPPLWWWGWVEGQRQSIRMEVKFIVIIIIIIIIEHGIAALDICTESTEERSNSNLRTVSTSLSCRFCFKFIIVFVRVKMCKIFNTNTQGGLYTATDTGCVRCQPMAPPSWPKSVSRKTIWTSWTSSSGFCSLQSQRRGKRLAPPGRGRGPSHSTPSGPKSLWSGKTGEQCTSWTRCRCQSTSSLASTSSPSVGISPSLPRFGIPVPTSRSYDTFVFVCL